MAETSNPRKVQKIGNSQGITIPREFLEHIDVQQGDCVVVEKDEDTLTVEKVTWTTA